MKVIILKGTRGYIIYLCHDLALYTTTLYKILYIFVNAHLYNTNS